MKNGARRFKSWTSFAIFICKALTAIHSELAAIREELGALVELGDKERQERLAAKEANATSKQKKT